MRILDAKPRDQVPNCEEVKLEISRTLNRHARERMVAHILGVEFPESCGLSKEQENLFSIAKAELKIGNDQEVILFLRFLISCIPPVTCARATINNAVITGVGTTSASMYLANTVFSLIIGSFSFLIIYYSSDDGCRNSLRHYLAKMHERLIQYGIDIRKMADLKNLKNLNSQIRNSGVLSSQELLVDFANGSLLNDIQTEVSSRISYVWDRFGSDDSSELYHAGAEYDLFFERFRKSILEEEYARVPLPSDDYFQLRNRLF